MVYVLVWCDKATKRYGEEYDETFFILRHIEEILINKKPLINPILLYPATLERLMLVIGKVIQSYNPLNSGYVLYEKWMVSKTTTNIFMQNWIKYLYLITTKYTPYNVRFCYLRYVVTSFALFQFIWTKSILNLVVCQNYLNLDHMSRIFCEWHCWGCTWMRKIDDWVIMILKSILYWRKLTQPSEQYQRLCKTDTQRDEGILVMANIRSFRPL